MALPHDHIKSYLRHWPCISPNWRVVRVKLFYFNAIMSKEKSKKEDTDYETSLIVKWRKKSWLMRRGLASGQVGNRGAGLN